MSAPMFETEQAKTARVRAAIAQFPAEFRLRHLGDQRCRIEERDSYVDDRGVVQLYVHIRGLDGTWLAFSKGTAAELRSVIAP